MFNSFDCPLQGTGWKIDEELGDDFPIRELKEGSNFCRPLIDNRVEIFPCSSGASLAEISCFLNLMCGLKVENSPLHDAVTEQLARVGITGAQP